MKFNSEAPFPSFWFETQNCWGQVHTVSDLEYMIERYLSREGFSEKYPYGDVQVSDVLHLCKNAYRQSTQTDDMQEFGRRREHQNGTTTLWDYLVEKGVIEL